MMIPAHHLVAHRGHRDAFPENSLLAIADALTLGAQHIEFDIQVTREGRVVLYHDQEMQRVSGLNQSIIELSQQGLSQCRVYEPARWGQRFADNPINTLDELFPLIIQYPDVQFFLEIKEESLRALGHRFCLEAITAALPVRPDNLIAISFDLAVTVLARSYGFKRTGLVLREWQQRNQRLKEAKADYGFINYQRLPAEAAVEACVPMILYEIADPSLAQHWLQRGAMAIETFCIRQLLLGGSNMASSSH